MDGFRRDGRNGRAGCPRCFGMENNRDVSPLDDPKRRPPYDWPERLPGRARDAGLVGWSGLSQTQLSRLLSQESGPSYSA